MTSASPHFSGITGLRGVAVLSVIAYHLGYLPGGFLGVDVFFVLSGFLITTLLLRSTPTNHKELGQWWTRRFTRLTPAVTIMVIAVLIAFATTSGIAISGIATMTWWQNWHLIAQGTPYWAANPSPLRHAWSLSIEEQFYVLWPVTLIMVVGLSKRLAHRWRWVQPQVVVAALAAVLGLTSFCWAAYLALSGAGSLSRIYFGTDTRAGGLLIGCATAAALFGRPVLAASKRLTAVAAVAAVVLAALMFGISPEVVETYAGGLLLAVACSVALVVSACRTGAVASAMSWTPLQWVGVRSYSLYLWSWPVQVFVQERAPELPLAAVALITVVVSLGLSSISLRFIEEPLRRAHSWAQNRRPRRVAWLGGFTVLVIALLFATGSTKLTATELSAQDSVRLPDPTTTTSTTCPPPPVTAPTPTFSDQSTEFDIGTVDSAADPTAAVICGTRPIRVLIVGDSTGRGAVNGLRRLGQERLEVWDRTEFGCGVAAPLENCSDYLIAWPEAVAQISPEVVVIYQRAAAGSSGDEGPDYLSAEASTARQAQMTTAMQLVGSAGAKVVWVLPATLLPRGAFYCQGQATNSICDPAWLQRWREDAAASAANLGINTIDVQTWVDTRPSEQAESDRPDGLHFSGPALEQFAPWFGGKISTIASPPKD
ncbi:MAG: acyltransferase family protein [Microthrixaceae bacterium]